MTSVSLTPELLQRIMPHARAPWIAKYFPYLEQSMALYQIDTVLRKSHFLAQVAHESGELRYTEELASGRQYEGRKDLGNVQAGDGERFKGRGLLQLTGRAEYSAFSLACGTDLMTEDHPALLATEPALAMESAAWYWSVHRLNYFADVDELLAITRCINGGLNGLASREAYLARAKACLVPLEPLQIATLHGKADELFGQIAFVEAGLEAFRL
ncbi:glycoside hydrolase family 19 protein [Terriglobus saanensis]|uniref:Glycoside hydrolase family 19 n=1 Tax=Terriglobus saanensis (strain ATCC BAA-1853 / DSM 23119 / SP1PR4) TaxID=401053 RepID=E8V8T8_TERSS|nr:glycoside hydrolase family 19 protein [Terriglobus saanensis]ADV84125.1 glycoside hydrolase family 19 [Terriglobus saanensis SP1PR4]